MVSPKPDSMSVKEHLYRKVSLEIGLDYSIVKTVIDNQFSTALTALTDININSLEIAGLGKILLNKRRLKQEIRKMRYLLELYPAYLLIEDLTLKEIEDTQENLIKVSTRLKDYLERAEHLQIEVPIEEDLPNKIKATIRKKLKERNESKKN